MANGGSAPPRVTATKSSWHISRNRSGPRGPKGPGRGLSWRKIALIGGLALLILSAPLALFRGMAVDDLRSIEEVYMRTRDTTACITQALKPFAFPEDELDLDELFVVVGALVKDAAAEARETREKYEELQIVPFPPLRAAHESLGRAVNEQVALYEELDANPDASDYDDLTRVGTANNDTEENLATARAWLLADPHEDWPRRFICDIPIEASTG